MTTKEYLKKYRARRMEADAIQCELRELDRRKRDLRAYLATGMPKRKHVKDLSDPLQAIDEMTQRLKELVQSYMGMEVAILMAIDEMDSHEERAVLRHRYFSETGTSWEEIAKKMHVSVRTAQYIHGSALQHLRIE